MVSDLIGSRKVVSCLKKKKKPHQLFSFRVAYRSEITDSHHVVSLYQKRL